MNNHFSHEAFRQPDDELSRRRLPHFLRRIARIASHTWFIGENDASVDTYKREVSPRVSRYSVASELHPERNEDNCFTIDSPKHIIAGGVFDGVGGSPGSERASYNAANIIFQQFNQLSSDIMTPDDAAELAHDAFIAANKAIREDRSYIATTAAMASLHTHPDNGERFVNIAWAGDSRITVIREGRIHYRTLDDSIARSLPVLDELFPHEAPEYRQQAFFESVENSNVDPSLTSLFRSRNIIKNCLDGGGGIAIHAMALYTEPGDIILITTDGIHDNLTNAEILETISTGGSIAELVNVALERSRDDEHIRAKCDDITGVLLVA